MVIIERGANFTLAEAISGRPLWRGTFKATRRIGASGLPQKF